MEFNCSCCGHINGQPCECPNRPSDFDLCQPRNKYMCHRCGRGYLIAHVLGIKLPDDACPHRDCTGKLKHSGSYYRPMY